MATLTTNISLTKPELSDTTKIREDINANSDIIDGRFSSTYLAVQNKNAVTITGGTIAGVTITGGSITGMTDLAIADGGTGSSTAANARTALGVAIGSNVQAYDAGLLSIAALTTSADKMIYTTGSDTYATATLTVFARTILDDDDASTVRGTLGIDLSLYYLQSAINTQAKMETIWGVTLLNDITGESIGDLSDVDLTDIANEKILQYNSTSGKWECETAAAGNGGYTNLTSFVDQVAWRVFYSNTAGNVTELAFGTDGQYLKSNGQTSAPTWATPAGTGDVSATGTPVDNEYAKFTDGTTIEGRSYAEVKTDLNLIKCKDNATTAPTTGDDSDDGYAVNSIWGDITNDKSYICLDTTVNSAVWKEISLPRLDDCSATEDNVDLNSSTSAHGLLKKLNNDDTTWMDGKGSWTAPTAGEVGAATAALDNLASVAINTALILGTSDAYALGSTTKMWADLFLASGGVIDFNDGDVTLTHSADTLTLGGGNTIVLALGSNNITMTGSIADTTNRVTKLWATDVQVTNDIAGSITGNAETVTFIDNNTTAENNEILFAGNAAASGDCVVEADSDFHYNPSTGIVTATAYAGDGSALTNVGVSAATGLTLTVRASGNIKKGQAVYISGSTGAAYPNVSLADADDAAKIRVIGVAAEDIDNAATGFVRMGGLLEGVDTSTGTGTDLNPDDETWTAGQSLYLRLDGTGAYTKNRPTSGRVIKVAHSLYGDWATDDFVVIPHINAVDMATTAGGNIRMRLGHTDGSTSIIIKNYSDSPVASIDDQGGADFNSLTLDTALASDEGGTGVKQVSASSTLTITGAYGLTLTIGEATNVTLPVGTSTLVNTAVATLSSLTSIGTIGTGVWEGTDVGLAHGGTGVGTGAMVNFTSILNAALYIGRDANNTISFVTDNHIIFKTNGATCMEIDDTGELDMNANTIGFTQQTVSYNSETTTVDWRLGNKAIMTFGAGNITTFAFTNPTNPCNLLLKIVQDGSGSRTVTNWDTDIKYPGGTDPTLSTAGNSVDIISFYWDGANYHGVISKAFAVPA